MSITETILRLSRLPRHHRIAHLRAVIPLHPARSIDRKHLEEYLEREVRAQLRKEIRAA